MYSKKIKNKKAKNHFYFHHVFFVLSHSVPFIFISMTRVGLIVLHCSSLLLTFLNNFISLFERKGPINHQIYKRLFVRLHLQQEMTQITNTPNNAREFK